MNHRSLSDSSLDMQSPYYPDSYSSYSSSPGGMDFFFYGAQPVYDPLCDLDPISPFPIQEVAAPDVYNITSSPYYPTTHEFPVFERQIMPQSASSCASSCASSSFNFPGEDIALPNYPVSVSGYEYESGSDSPAPASKPAKPFGCDDCGKAFTRFADLKRHQSSVHYPVFRNCPVDHCSRKGSNGFPRQDHLVEHLRSYHHMNVPKRGGCKRAAKEIS
ncbi:hypothetical protein PENARI_c020G00051 [Penicillium arizonense]|uniref:C2H2-type domain-containing protein n=1 Tax=Penicillium arizonense TaxID=1835702 RepID=A0A1F5L8S6_PENAI|nr:hypothetical protein PENARI_c020G00051 [Penicillium arizonense]OGE49638.1 hypothetical protein PENARI_c020G00051 [Penicillium arizonense]